MSEWKKQIRKICRDFYLPKETYNKIVKETEKNKREMPRFYNGDKDKYMYDVAYSQAKSYIMKAY